MTHTGARQALQATRFFMALGLAWLCMALPANLQPDRYAPYVSTLMLPVLMARTLGIPEDLLTQADQYFVAAP